MSNPVQRGPGNDAFGGGALIRAAPPTSGPTGALAGPNTSTPLGGVNPPSTPFFARPNSGTNIKIPYNRVVPLSDPRASGLKAVRTNPAARPIADPGDFYFGMHGDAQQKEFMSETDTLKATRLAFILAKKSNTGMAPGGNSANNDDARNFSYAINSTIAPTLPGTQKLQKLCSFEYLQRYIDATANRPGPASSIHLSTKGNDPLYNTANAGLRDPPNRGPLSDASINAWQGNNSYPGLLGETLAEALNRGAKRRAALEAVPAAGAGALVAGKGPEIKAAQANIQPAAAAVGVANLRTGDEELVRAYRAALTGAQAIAALDTREKTYSKINEIQAAYKHDLAFSGLPPPSASLCNIGDLSRLGGAIGSAMLPNPTVGLGPRLVSAGNVYAPSTMFDRPTPAAQSDFLRTECARLGNANPVIGQGIFTRDEGPFLRGRGVEVASTVVKTGQVGDPASRKSSNYNVGRCRGDEIAFAVLERELEQNHHLFDWTPDGLLMSKLDNVPLDKLEDQRIDARDGMLYNVCIQGPSLATNWTGDPRMEVLPMDKVFIVVVADLQSGQLSGGAFRGGNNPGGGAPIVPPTPVGFAATEVVRAETQERQLGDFIGGANVFAISTLLATAGNDETRALSTLNELDGAGNPKANTSYQYMLETLAKNVKESLDVDQAATDADKASAFALWDEVFQIATDDDPAAGLLMQYQGAQAAIQSMEDRIKGLLAAATQALSNGLPDAATIQTVTGAPVEVAGTTIDVTGAAKIADYLMADTAAFFNGSKVVSGSGAADELYKNAKLQLTQPNSLVNDAARQAAVGLVAGGMRNMWSKLGEVVKTYADELINGGGWYSPSANAGKFRTDLGTALALPRTSAAEITARETAVRAAYEAAVTGSRLAQQIYLNLRAVANVQLLAAARATFATRADQAEAALRARAEALVPGGAGSRRAAGASVGLKLAGFTGLQLAISGRYPLSEFTAAPPGTLADLFAAAGGAAAGSAADVYARYTLGDATTAPSRAEYLKARDELLEESRLVDKPGTADATGGGGVTIEGDLTSYETFKAEARREFERPHEGLTRKLTNFRLMYATSSQMINYSALKFDRGTGEQTPTSRMGLKLGNRLSEYIIGGWCIGTVTDAAASRAAMPNGAAIGPKTAPNTAAVNLHVNIEWWNSDRMYRSYCNVKGQNRGLIRARFEPPEETAGGVKIREPQLASNKAQKLV